MLYSISADLTGNGGERQALLSLYFFEKKVTEVECLVLNLRTLFSHTRATDIPALVSLG